MITYSQSTGEMTLASGVVFHGHAGQGSGLNNPDMQNVHGIGPLPQGTYTLGPWQDGAAYGPSFHRLGPFITRLTPDEGNEMFGRWDFCIHGGDGSNPPTDSEGCIVLFRSARVAIAASKETQLTVIA
jgi:hypothetical protein